jgi:DNA-binding NarL/FixJ family response regulator
MSSARREIEDGASPSPSPVIVRVLLVDDFEPFRDCVRSLIQPRPEWLVIGEASDGLEAVEKAEALQPDLVLLDIGLPNLSGIEAARRIRLLSPESKLIFLSQVSSAEVIQEALGLGAAGYVVKAHAGSELLAVVEAVLQGKQFVGSGMQGHNSTDAMN